MTAAGAARGRRGKEQAPRRADAAPTNATLSEPLAPLAPQRKLFVTLMIVLAAWVALLLVMYFTTVRR